MATTVTPPIPSGESEASEARMPDMPLTLDGSAMLHQMARMRWAEWRALAADERSSIAAEAAKVLAEMESHPEGGSAVFAELGHKGDLLFVHFRKAFDGVGQAELALQQTRLFEYLEIETSYVSTVELGLYESSVQLYEKLMADGLEPDTDEWDAAVAEKIGQQEEAMAPRLWPKVPPHRYVCFYPMDKKRGERFNWYDLPIEERRRMMRDHGRIGRKYGGRVRQIISGSIGFDDWEWGVDLFANDPLVFKQLIYEMRFDEASALYALFGKFYLGLRFEAAKLSEYLDGRMPAYEPPPIPESRRPGA